MTTSFTHDSRHLAETYERVSDLQFEGGRRLVERLGLEEGAHVLDIGCGTGRLARWIGKRIGPKGSVVGIDPFEERIGIARSHGGAVRFEVGQAEALGAFEDASCDALKAMVFLPAAKHGYAQPPYETITAEQYGKISDNLELPGVTSS